MDRRDFLHGLMAGAAAYGSSALHSATALAGSGSASSDAAAAAPRRLAVSHRTIEVKGRSARVFGLGPSSGVPGLTLDAGGSFDVALTNELDAPTLIHWHGLTPPWEQDGVPDNPAALLRPGETRRYGFPAGAGGTHWMHAHTLQEQNLLAAPLIVRTAADRQRDEQEVVILLHDFSFTPAEEILARLQRSHSGGHRPATASTAHETAHGVVTAGRAAGAMAGHAMHGAPAQAAMDLNDIDYDAYLANDRTLDDPQVVAVEKGGRVRLRIINGATATAFTIDCGALPGELIAVDGRDVQPVSGHSFPLAMGQRLDIRLTLPKAGGSHPILALREGALERTGIILASTGAPVRRIAAEGEIKGPIVGLDLEQRLRALTPQPPRSADRRFTLTLTGTMAGYHWGLEGGDAMKVGRGERVEIALINMSMMAHPMHLHGHHFQVTAINDAPIAGAVRDTVLVPPMARVRIAFDADNPGRWPLHCHHLYHMAAGMMAFVDYVS